MSTKNITPIFRGRVENGRLQLRNPEQFKTWVSLLKGEVEIVVKRFRQSKLRSEQQNNYYWGVVIAILADYFGDEDPYDTHESLLWELSRAPRGEGKPDKIIRSSEMSTVEFEDYMARIRMWAAKKFAVYIPMPNEVEIA